MDVGQVRRAPRMNGRFRWLFSGAFGAVAALLVYCSAAPPPAKPTAAPVALGAPKPSASAALPAAAPPALSLETLTPLLARPGFESALAAFENEDPNRALAELAAALAASPPSADLIAPFAFVRARLFEQTGDAKSALREYERAAATSWPLAPDAELGAARALLIVKRPGDAIGKLGQAAGSRLLERRKLLLSADAALAGGDRPRALAAFRAYLAAKPPSDGGQVALRLASELLSAPSGSVTSVAEALEALELSRGAGRQAAGDTSLEKKAEELAKRALLLLPEPDRAEHARERPEQALERALLLVEARRFEDAEKAADELLLAIGERERFGAVGCETQQLRAKALAGQREWGKAVDSLGDVIRRCQANDDLHARALFLAGRYAASDKRHAASVKFFGELEAKHRGHTLADDARLYAAFSYLELGSEARFTELLQSMPEDYAQGDMVLEGVFRLAVRRMDKSDWSGAARVLERAIALLKNGDAARGQELAGRERYFFARAELALGRREQAMVALEEVVQSFPLSYYMLWAYSRLQALSPERARACFEKTLSGSKSEAFSIPQRSEFASDGFLRVLWLLRVGDTASAMQELDELGLSGPDAAPEILWGVSLAYARAGALRLSHDVPRRRLKDWLLHWPVGEWQEAWQLAFPRPWPEAVEREAKKNSVEVPLVYAVMREESAFDPAAVSIANAYGLMQLIVPTAKHVARGTNLPHDREALKRPTVNIALGSRALSQLQTRFSENPLLAIAAYNAGPSNARDWLNERPSADFDLWIELIPFLETRRYMKRVLASRATYAFVYGTELAAPSLPLKVKP